MSLKVVPFKRLCAAVSVTVCDIFSVKELPDHENRVRVRSRSLEMEPIELKYLSCLHTRSGHL